MYKSETAFIHIPNVLLQSVMYVSTAFAHCTRMNIDEITYKYHMSHRDVEKILEEQTFKDNINPELLQIAREWPNTYTLSKAMAESLVNERRSELPVGIFRPAIGLIQLTTPKGDNNHNLYNFSWLYLRRADSGMDWQLLYNQHTLYRNLVEHG